MTKLYPVVDLLGPLSTSMTIPALAVCSTVSQGGRKQKAKYASYHRANEAYKSQPTITISCARQLGQFSSPPHVSRQSKCTE